MPSKDQAELKRCYRCFELYESKYNVCPHCGHNETVPLEPQYLRPGTILQGRYLLGVVIGAGGFGTTYAAWDQVLEQKVAVKEFLPGEFSTRMPGQTQVTVYGGEKTEQFEDGKSKFYEESRKLAKFQEIPGIVRIYNSFEENGTAYIVMEYLEGETLAQRLQREKKLPEQEAIRIMLPVLQALEAVHKEGILHRDIAPNNIFLTTDGEVKLLDFGAARSVTGTYSKSLTVLYKEGYTPEEQYRSRGDQGTWTDVYACSATMYHMLTGKVPAGALERRRKDTLKAPSKAGAKISRQTDRAVMNALNVEIKNRTQTAEQFLLELSGQIKAKEHFVRTVERKIGRIPRPVFLISAVSAAAMVLFLLLLATGVIQFEIYDFGNFGVPEGRSRVPNIVNREVKESEELLAKRELGIRIMDKQFSEEIPKDRILTQSMSAGSIAPKGELVEVVVSGGEKNQGNGYELQEGETFVPDVQYKTLEEALSLIEEAGMEAEVAYELVENVEKGKVIRQSLEAGTVEKQGKRIQIVINDEEPEQESETEEEETQERGEPESQTEGNPEKSKKDNRSEGLQIAEAQKVMELLNQARVEAGLPLLAWNNEMEENAKAISFSFAHGQGEYQYYNVIQGSMPSYISGELFVNSTLRSWSKNILNNDVHEIGCAYYYIPGQRCYWILCYG